MSRARPFEVVSIGWDDEDIVYDATLKCGRCGYKHVVKVLKPDMVIVCPKCGLKAVYIGLVCDYGFEPVDGD